MKHIYILLLTLCFYNTYSQCVTENLVHIVTDYRNIDINEDGLPDGFLNLRTIYEQETGNIAPPGNWRIFSELSTTLDSATGNFYGWDILQASNIANANDHSFELITSSCGDIPFARVTIRITSFSGIAQQAFGLNNVNLEVCSNAKFTLFSALTSDEETPPPHQNGQWFDITEGEPGFLTVENPTVEVEYQPDVAGVDRAIRDYKYVVNGFINGISSKQETTIRLSVVRLPNCGISKPIFICESALKEGLFNNDINLFDDTYLFDEDIGGLWSLDPYGEIENSLDSFVNLRNIYDIIINDPNKGVKFGKEQIIFTYSIDSRSPVCINQSTNIIFNFYEELRPITTKNNQNSFCENGAIKEVALFNFIEFTTEDGIDFIYPNESSQTSWNYIDGPRNSSGLIEEVSLSPSGKFRFLTPDINDDPDKFILPGTYTFRYTVLPTINSPTDLNNPCTEVSTIVTINLLPADYAGEDNSLEICSNIGTINLFEQLAVDTNRAPIIKTGIWTNSDDEVISEQFLVPFSRTKETYQLTYTTLTSNGCEDEAVISLSVSPGPYAGIANPPIICGDTFPLILFNELSDNPETTGIWTGPNGFVSTDHFGIIENEEVLLPGTYVYRVEGEGETICAGTFDTEELTLRKRANLGIDFMATSCSSLGTVDLFNLLGPSANMSGTFTDDSSTGLLNANGILDVATLASGDYIFTYRINDNLPCDDGEVQLTLRLSRDEEVPNAGTNNEINLCTNARTVNLFDSLGGTPEMTGTWTGPFGYSTTNNIANFIEGDTDLPVLQPGIYTYTIIGNNGCGSQRAESQVTVNLVAPPFIGDNFIASFCVEENNVNLFDLLDRNTDRGGNFSVINSEDQSFLSNTGVFDFSEVDADRTFELTYTLAATTICSESSLTASIEIIKIPKPLIPNRTFCVLEATKLTDVEVGENEIWFENLLSNQPFISDPVLKDGMVFYLEKQERGCVSERTAVEFRILNLGQIDKENGVEDCSIKFQDVVTPNTDNRNDTFTLDIEVEGVFGKNFNIPDAFPAYELKIYNRYGVLVYEAQGQEPEFDGSANVNNIRGNLSTGIYFYVFEPNFENNQPIQGSFYLSK